MPVSVPRSVGQVPIFYNHTPLGMRSNIYGDYVTEPFTPLFPFGHGLSYTSFTFSDLAISKPEAGIGESIDVSLTLTNQGPRAGDEVVQLYIQDEYAFMPRPVKEIKGFKRLSLQPGESRRVTFHLPVNQLSYFDEDLDLLVEAGRIILMVGSSSEDIRLMGEFNIRETGKLKLNERVFNCPVSLG